MAFGTGHHGTTYGILTEMVNMKWAGTSVLDMGCGSGVLGIYAAIKERLRSWPLTSTHGACAIPKRTCRSTASSETAAFEVREGGAGRLNDVATGHFDVVVANINRNILLEDMDAYCRVLGESGTLMLSGFMEPDIAALVDAAGQHGLRLEATRAESEWRILTLRR